MQNRLLILLLILCVSLMACKPQDAPVTEPAQTTDSNAYQWVPALRNPDDTHSYSQPEKIKTTHLQLDLQVDFEQKQLIGTAALDLERLDTTEQRLILDTRDLDIESVTGINASGDQQALSFSLGESQAYMGQPLTIELSADTEQVVVFYRTSPQASGLQWLDTEQTAGGRAPFLFSQSQANHARSWAPLQDSPQVRLTYQARISVPEGLMAVMSAANPKTVAEDGVYQFNMPQAIPSYLLALAVGDLGVEQTGPRTTIYAEPELLEASVYEFADTEAMIQAGEALYGPYRWEEYDLLILPPSFPFGGMENPRLSFITPTVLAGDRSLVALIAHELAHSWSGNLVTNANWRDLWLNEGFTVYFEARIMEAVYGSQREAIESVLGYKDLMQDLSELSDEDQILTIDLAGRDPDDVFSSVPYEKGRLFLTFLEEAFGRDRFDTFLRNYFDDFAFQSITTGQFVDYLRENLLDRYPDTVSESEIQEWITRSGLPQSAVIPESDAFSRVDDLRTQWLQGDIGLDALPSDNWSVHEWLAFINDLPNPLSVDKMAELDSQFDLTNTGNNEIAFSWLKLAIGSEYQPAIQQRLEDFLVSIGRNKFIEPLYKELVKTDWGRAFALQAFSRARTGYHPLSVSKITRVFEQAGISAQNQ